MSTRPEASQLLVALRDHPTFLHFLVGPRQVGKTTAARALTRLWSGPVHYAAADELLPPSVEWLGQQWAMARKLGSGGGPALLVLDEIQKIPRWSEAVKALWDADRWADRDLRVLCLGSSALLLQRGLTESLAGRFMLHRGAHWSWPEMHETFGVDLDHWIYFGGYPGAGRLLADETTWRAYVRDALVEAAIARDVLAMQPVNRPALLRQLFALSCHYPAQALSLNKMLGHLQDAGNATTLASYLELLANAFLVSGLQKWSPGAVRRRASSPKLVVWNNALVSAVVARDFEQAREDHAWWGRLVENAVGAHLLNHLGGSGAEVYWWREGDQEVDFVVSTGRAVWAIEVKSGPLGSLAGLEAFRSRNPGARSLVVGPGGMALEDFFSADPRELLEAR